MRVPTAFAHQARFQTAVKRCEQLLASQGVVRILPTFGEDWSGEPAVFFMIILADAAISRDRLWSITDPVSQAIVETIRPWEQWGVLPYFNFRSQSEQAELDQPVLV